MRAALGPALGKGDAMWRALAATDGEIVCFLDGDTADPDPRHLLGLLGPLLRDPALALVKGAFDRPFRAGRISRDEGGRVTELMARPIINLHFPLLAGFAQPLAGEFAAPRALLERLSFPVGYGVEIAMLIDALRAGGLDALASPPSARATTATSPCGRSDRWPSRCSPRPSHHEPSPRSPVGGHFLQPWEAGHTVMVPIDDDGWPPSRRAARSRWRSAAHRSQRLRMPEWGSLSHSTMDPTRCGHPGSSICSIVSAWSRRSFPSPPGPSARP